MRTFLRNNGLALAMFGLFVVFFIGLSLTGWSEENSDLAEHGEPAIGLLSYLTGSAFGEAVFENWESEFLQMAGFVVLTALLVQRGSPDSKPMAGRNPSGADPRRRSPKRRGAPWAVKAGGIWLSLYEHSLTIALTLLFLLSFALHAVTGAADYSAELQSHGAAPMSALAYLGTARFWFESFQNWQSEFLSVGLLIVLSIFLRQRGSPESKPVDAPHAETGSE